MRRLKVFLAVLGFLVAAVGVAIDQRLLVWAAMVFLAGSLALRLVLRRRERSESEDPA